MNEGLSVLAGAIYDLGSWRWWVDDFPDAFQVEFGGVQLWTPPPRPDQPPRGMVALRFDGPLSVTFLTQGDELPDDWPARLHRDEMEPLSIPYEDLAFGPPGMIRELLARATCAETVFGAPADEVDWAKAGAALVFWAGPAGLAVAASSVAVVTHDGEIALEELPELHRKWWNYWREYWDRRERPDALPYDWMCEVTIPIKGP
jgi:hypothetical protein